MNKTTNGMRKYKPIKVFSLHFGEGWWWGKYLWFFNTRHPKFWQQCFAIVPMSRHVRWTDMPEEWHKMIRQEEYSWKFFEKL